MFKFKQMKSSVKLDTDNNNNKKKNLDDVAEESVPVMLLTILHVEVLRARIVGKEVDCVISTSVVLFWVFVGSACPFLDK